MRNFKSADYQASMAYIVKFKNGNHGIADLSFKKIGENSKISRFYLD